MYCLFIIFLSIMISFVHMGSVEQDIKLYFKSDTMLQFKKEWDNHRKPLEHAIALAVKETVGFGGMNVYIRRVKEPLATGYFHNDNQVRLILSNLRLEDMPRCWMPEVQFSLTSNVLKLQTILSKMIIHAEYSLIRNKTDIIFETNGQDPFKTSPFLFQQVRDSGKIAITMDGCLLTGYVMTTLSGESINLGYQHFRIINCQYSIEIYREGSGSPPVIARYSFSNEEPGLSLTHLLLKPINDELVPKLQAAMFSFVNTTSMFTHYLSTFIDRQENVFHVTSNYLMEVIRKLNKISAENDGALNVPDYNLVWDDGKEHATTNETVGQNLMLKDVIMTGLDTLYSAHIGGPFKMNSVIIGEEIRFSTLQVRGNMELHSNWVDDYAFAAELRDVAVDIQLDVKPEQSVIHGGKNGKVLRESASIFLRNLEVTGFRQTSLTVPAVIFSSAESLLAGYLAKELPKVISGYLKSIFPEALVTIKAKPEEPKEPAIPSVSSNDDSQSELKKVIIPTDVEIFKSLEDGDKTEPYTNIPLKDVFQKNKKRFAGLVGK